MEQWHGKRESCIIHELYTSFWGWNVSQNKIFRGLKELPPTRIRYLWIYHQRSANNPILFTGAVVPLHIAKHDIDIEDRRFEERKKESELRHEPIFSISGRSKCRGSTIRRINLIRVKIIPVVNEKNVTCPLKFP